MIEDPDWLLPSTTEVAERERSAYSYVQSGREDGHGHLSADGTLCAECRATFFAAGRPRTHEEAVRMNPNFNRSEK
jgi:hypothetical protein